MADRPRGIRRPIDELRFVVVGAYVMDVFVNTPRLPAWGDEYLAQSIRSSPGGKALNQAVALARLGAQVTAVGAVGDDGMGREIVEVLRREGVDTRCLQVRDGAATAICVIFVGEDGENSVVWRVGDDVAVTPETVRAADGAFEGADAVLITFEMPAASVREAIGLGRNHSACVVVQPAPPLDDPEGAASLPWDLVDVLIPNENEARALLAARQGDGGVPAEELAGVLSAELAVPQVVVTLGALGCVVHAHGESQCYAAPKAEAVDTTGASDAFTSTFVAQFVSGTAEREAVRVAQTAAAAAIGRPGGHEAMPLSFDR